MEQAKAVARAQKVIPVDPDQAPRVARLYVYLMDRDTLFIWLSLIWLAILAGALAYVLLRV